MNAKNLNGLNEYTDMIEIKDKVVIDEPVKRSLLDKLLNIVGLEIEHRSDKKSFSDFNSDGSLKK